MAILKIYDSTYTTLLFSTVGDITINQLNKVTRTGVTFANGEKYVYDGNKKFLGLQINPNETDVYHPIGKSFYSGGTLFLMEGEIDSSKEKMKYVELVSQEQCVNHGIPIEITTADEMNALLSTAEVGSIYKYTGETTDTYENGALYLVSVETSGDKNFRTLIVGSSVIGNLPAIGTSLEDCTWEEISAISAAGKGAEYFKVGDTKSVYIKGTVGTLAVDTTLYVYILGFDHNKDITGNTGITFGTFKKANGLDVALCDSKYDTSVTSGGKYFNMNHFGGYNYGGWAASDLRYDILGSTDVAPSGYGSVKTTSSVGYDASPTCAIKPVANTLMAALPTDLRAVMKPMTIYTDNTGNKSDIEANVTATIDYLPLLADFEIFGKRNSSNTYEQNKQAQYTYFVAGNSKKKYKHTDTSASSFSNLWWERSASYFGNESFCFVDNVGTANGNYARMSYGLAPIFLV